MLKQIFLLVPLVLFGYYSSGKNTKVPPKSVGKVYLIGKWEAT